jgi:hypothetical protein
MSEPGCSPEGRVQQMLKILDTFCSESITAEMQTMANEAKISVNKMQNFLERPLVELVQAMQWDKVADQMKQIFPDGLDIEKVEEILKLIFLNGSVEHLVSAILWVLKLDVRLQSRAYEALYEQLKFKKLTNQPQVLLLRKLFGTLPKGRVSDKLRAQLDEDFESIVGQIVDEVKNEDYSLSLEINEMKRMAAGVDLIINEVTIAVVDKFDVFTLENTVLLIQFSLKLPDIENCCIFIDALMRNFEARMMMDSEQSLQLWTHAKYTMEEQSKWKNLSKETQKLCIDVVDRLRKQKLKFFQHYQKYVEGQDKQILQKMHTRNWHLCSIVPEFVTWYYKEEDLTRAQNLLSAARATGCFIAIERILTQLQIEMHKFQQMNTFEAFSLFNEAKYNMASRISYKNLEPKWKAPFEQLKAKAPTCLRLLLWPDQDQNQLQLVNKFYDSSLSIQHDKIICTNSSPDNELLCSATVDPITSMTTFSYKSGTKLDAAAVEDNTIKESWLGTRWKVKAVDDTHVKIFTDGEDFCI